MDVGLALGGFRLHRDGVRPPGARSGRDPGGDQRRLPRDAGVIVFATICILALNLVVDVLYAWIDPRIRLQ
ncbi:MAG TPA: hypothetical protein VGJ77_19510 [Gaiellaceae bacterium]